MVELTPIQQDHTIKDNLVVLVEEEEMELAADQVTCTQQHQIQVSDTEEK